MLKKFARRINLNFRQTRGERSANTSYGNYNHRIKRMIMNVIPFKKINRQVETLKKGK